MRCAHGLRVCGLPPSVQLVCRPPPVGQVFQPALASPYSPAVLTLFRKSKICQCARNWSFCDHPGDWRIGKTVGATMPLLREATADLGEPRGVIPRIRARLPARRVATDPWPDGRRSLRDARSNPGAYAPRARLADIQVRQELSAHPQEKKRPGRSKSGPGRRMHCANWDDA